MCPNSEQPVDGFNSKILFGFLKSICYKTKFSNDLMKCILHFERLLKTALNFTAAQVRVIKSVFKPAEVNSCRESAFKS